MKKLLLLLLGVSLLTSCSNDEESTIFNDSPTNTNVLTQERVTKSAAVDPVLKGLYIDMINSPSYKAFDDAVKAFGDKLGDDIPDSEMEDESKMLNWISNNLTLTGFSSYQVAVQDWDNVVGLSSIAIDANYSFHEYLAGTTSGELLKVIELVEPQPQPTNCEECYAQFQICSKSAHSKYTNAVELAAYALKKGYISDHGYGEACAAASLARNKAIRKCHQAMDNCCPGPK